MKKVKNVLFLLIFSILLFFVNIVEATEETGQDIMFVVDASYSMKLNDPQHNIYDAIHYMASVSVENNNRIGYVLYNDSIIRDQDLREVKNQGDMENMLNELKNVEPIKGTDVGLGLKTAQRLLNLGNKKNNHAMMIVLSDGDVETDASNPNRSQHSVDTDINQVIDTTDIPIYVIQYSEVEHRNQAPMNTWPEKTGAKHYTAENPEQLLASVMDIYSHQTKMSAEKDSLKSKQNTTKESYTLTIPIKKTETKRVKEIIVTMQATTAIKEIEYENETGFSVKENNNQAIIKITHPKKDYYQLTYKTENNLPVKTTALTKMEDIPIEPKEKTTTNWKIVVLVLGGMAIGIILTVVARKTLGNDKKQEVASYFFTNSLEGCFIKTPNNEDIPIQNWAASIFERSKMVTLYSLLDGESIREKMPDSKKVCFRIGRNDSLEMRIKGKVEGIQQGREIPQGVWTTLNLQKSGYLIFIEDELELEVHIRKTSTNY